MNQEKLDSAAYKEKLMNRTRKAKKTAVGFDQEKADEPSAAITCENAACNDFVQEFEKFSFEQCSCGGGRFEFKNTKFAGLIEDIFPWQNDHMFHRDILVSSVRDFAGSTGIVVEQFA